MKDKEGDFRVPVIIYHVFQKEGDCINSSITDLYKDTL